MKKITPAILALFLCAWAHLVSAQMASFFPGPGTVHTTGGGTPFSSTWISSVGSATAGTSFTFSAQNIGSTDATRILYVAVGFGLVNTSPTTATIDFGLGGGAQALTQVPSSFIDSGGGATLAWYTIAAPNAATTATFNFQWGSSQSRVTIDIYNVQGTGVSISDTQTANSPSPVSTISKAANIPIGGGALAATYAHSSGLTGITPTNLTNDNTLIIGTSDLIVGHNTSASGSTTMGQSWTGTSDVALSIITLNP